MPPSPDRRDGRNQGRAAEDGTLHSDTQAKLEFLKSAAHKNSLNMLPAALDELWDATAGSEMVAEMIGDDLESFNTLVYLSRTVQARLLTTLAIENSPALWADRTPCGTCPDTPPSSQSRRRRPRRSCPQ
jgi:hypothetical protein